MRKGDSVELKMEKVLHMKGVKDQTVHACTVLGYDAEREYIYLLLQSGELADVSLDAIYDCKIQGEEEQVNCTGRICERYRGKAGKILEFQIKNGFYKINLKLVDKQMT